MKKRFIRLLSLFMVIALLALAGCGTEPAEPTEAAATIEPTANTPEPVEEVVWPEKDVTIIVPFAAGGGTDVVARALAEALKESTGKNFIIENIAGGSGAIGMTEGANAAADGLTLTIVAVNLCVFTNTNPDITIGIDDFSYLTMYNARAHSIAVQSSAPYDTYEELIEYMEENPGELLIGHGGAGSATHFAAAGWLNAEGVEASYVPYDGMSSAIAALLGSSIDIVCASVEEVAPYVESGDLKILSVMGSERHPQYPDVPTLLECGCDWQMDTWMGVAAPAGIDEALREAINAQIVEAMESDTFKSFMESSNYSIDVLELDAFTEKVSADYEGFKEVAALLGY